MLVPTTSHTIGWELPTARWRESAVSLIQYISSIQTISIVIVSDSNTVIPTVVVNIRNVEFVPSDRRREKMKY